MNYVLLSKNEIVGMLRAASKNDVRYYLNGVCVEFDKGLCVSTNGHVALVMRPSEIDGKGQSIFPRSLLEQVTKVPMTKGEASVPSIRFTVDGDTIEAALPEKSIKISGTAIDGKYPDWRMVVPKKLTDKPCLYSPELLYTIDRAISDIVSLKTAGVDIIQNGASGKDELPGAALVYSSVSNDVFGLIMPMRRPTEEHIKNGQAVTDNLLKCG